MSAVAARPGIIFLLLVGLAGCLVPSTLVGGPLRVGRPVHHLVGTVSFDRQHGSIDLELSPEACTQIHEFIDQTGALREEKRPCTRPIWSGVRLTAPWGQKFVPQVGTTVNRVRFAVDWTRTGVDPLAEGEPRLFRQPWSFIHSESGEEIVWTPQPAERSAMVLLVGAATDTQTGVSDVSAPPSVVVTNFHVEAELRNGETNVLELTVSNQGQGDAYRLYAITRSNVPALHGVRFSFGRLRPGESKTRRAQVKLPRDNDEKEALLVLEFEEAHRYTPAQTSTRLTVRPAVDQPLLSLGCHFDDAAGEPARVDAGTTIHLTCSVRNDGAAARSVRVRAEIGERSDVTSERFDLASDRSSTVTLAIDIPRDAAIDSKITVKVSARAQDYATALAQATLTVEVARPQICPEGRLSRAKFAQKRAELRKKLEAGLISKEEYERYEAALVGCLE